MLDLEQRQFWEANGFLILPRFFNSDQVETVVELHADLWRRCPSDIVVDDLIERRRRRMSDLTPEQKQHRFKLNDLYLQFEQIRSVALDRRLVSILHGLFADVPVLCNSLSLDYGSEQRLHQDSLYMTPQTENRLLASWIALEDGHDDAGLLQYFPGSHRIPTYYFSDGGRHEILEERNLWEQHISKHVDAMGLKKERFKPNKGDVFIWHSHLVHGGSVIRNPSLTRKSLINHYFGYEDARKLPFELRPVFEKAYWINREPPTLPNETAPEHQEKVKSEQTIKTMSPTNGRLSSAARYLSRVAKGFLRDFR